MNAGVLDALELATPVRWIAAGSAILAVTGVACWFLRRRSSEIRHFLWTLALATQLALPLLSALVPPLTLEVLPAAASGTSAPTPAALPRGGPAPVAETVMRTPSSQVDAVRPVDRIGQALPWIWSLGALWLLAGWLFEFVELARLRRRATLASVIPVELPKHLSVRFSAEIAVPMSWGFRRPVILLPEAARQWAPESLRLAILHEAAHLRRLDPLTRALAGLVCVFYWFHPLVWWAARRQRLESEKACDDRVLAAGSEPTSYAELLLDLAQGLAWRRRAGGSQTMAPAMADRAGLGARLRSILDPQTPRRRLGRRTAVAVTLAVAAMSIALVAVELVRREPVQGPIDASSPRSAWSLGDHQTPGAVEPLLTALAEGEPEVRLMAAWALGEIKDPRAIEPLAAVLSEDDFYLREMALLALGEHEDPRAVPHLVAFLDDPHPDLRSAALWSLGEIGGPQAEAAMVAGLDDEADAVRCKAAEALGRPRFASAAAALSARLSDVSAGVREAAAGALGKMRAQAAVEPLLAATSDPRATVRRAAVLALGRIGDAVVVDRLIPVLRDGDPQVRAAVVWALDEIHEG